MALLLAGLLPATVPTVSAAGNVRLSRPQAAPNDAVMVTGYGFEQYGRVTVTIDFKVQNATHRVVGVAGTSNTGQFSTSIQVPNGTDAGQYMVVVQDSQGHVARTYLTVIPLVLLQVGSKPTTVTVSANHGFYAAGRGFAARESVVIKANFSLFNGNVVTVSRTAIADSSGNFGEVLMTVPGTARAQGTGLTATGQSSKKTASATLNVTYHPYLFLVPTKAAPGATITVDGRGFVPNYLVHVSLSVRRSAGVTVTVTRQVTADANGAFSVQLALPGSASQGAYTVNAYQDSTNLRAATNLVIAVQPSLSIQPASIRPGQTVTVTGSGYAAHVNVNLALRLPLYGGGAKIITKTVTSDAAGHFSTQLTLPANAAAGKVQISAQGPRIQRTVQLTILRVNNAVTVSPASVTPGSNVTIRGSGYLSGGRIQITLVVNLTNGSHSTLTATATADKAGSFAITLRIPVNVAGGAYTLTAKNQSTSRAASAKLTVATLAPSIVAVPATVVPGTQITVNGAGFAGGQAVSVTLNGAKVGTATSDAAGKFSLKITVPQGLATGSYPLIAVSPSGRKAQVNLAVNRQFSTHFYFAAFYTGSGYHEYLALLNPSSIRARVTIDYLLTTGGTRTKTITINGHSRYTQDVNADLGMHASAGAIVSADVPIAAERLVYHGLDGAISPGVTSPSTSWYFANGNTSHGYREFLAIENPNAGAIQAAIHFFPTHHRAFTIYRNVPAMSRTTVKVNSYVQKDAVGVSVIANSPVVVNREMFTLHGMTSKIGTTSPRHSWYFAAGPRNPAATTWIGVTNPTNQRAYVWVRTYGSFGQTLGTRARWLRPGARVGYHINKIAHVGNAAVVVTSNRGIIAEQTSYVGKMHNASTDSFGDAAPGKSWGFAAVSTAGGQSDVLDLFNPGSSPIAVVVQFMTTSGKTAQRSYVIGSQNHLRVDVGSVFPNAQLGMVAASNAPFVALNRAIFNNGLGSDTSRGIPMS